MYGCKSWIIKKVEHQRIDAFELWCWRRLVRVPWTARRSVLGVHWKDWCWSWNSNALATSCEELTHLKRLWCWERLRAGGEGDDRGWDCWMATDSMDMSLSKLRELVMSSNHLILYCPLLLLPSIFPNIGVFSNESVLGSSGQSIGVSASVLVLPINIQD